MKTITVIAIYEAVVPEDMTVDQVYELCEDEVRNQLDDFRIYVDDYPDEDKKEPLFNLKNVKVGTAATIAVGGN